MKSLHIALVTGCALMSTPAEASKKGSDVYYVNGVWNMSKQVADESRRRLENSLRGHTGFQDVESDPNKLKFFTNYNSSGGYIDDVIAAIAQSTTEIGVVLGQYMLGYIPLSDVIKQPFFAITQKYTSDTWVSDADIGEHTKRYTTSLKACKRVLVVPHSQGNLYANRGYELTFKPGALSANFKRAMGISGIASPGVYVAGEVSNYTTSYQDLVINAIRIANPLVLLPNEFTAFSPVTAKDASGHKVVDTYLSNSIPGLRQSVLTAISSVGSRLQDAPNCETSILDLSPATSDSAALSDLINDSNNVDPTPVEPGKPLYLEGSGLGGAQFVVPGVTVRLTASAVNLPTDHPLYVAGAEVWKLSIPANAVVGSSGVIRAIINIDGVEQSFDSPRGVSIGEGADWRISRVGYAIPIGGRLLLGNNEYFCTPLRGAPYDGHPGYQRAGFLGAVRIEQNGTSKMAYDNGNSLSGFNTTKGWNERSSSTFCANDLNGYSDIESADTSMLEPGVWIWKRGAYGNPNWSLTSFEFEGFIEQKKRTDGMCNRTVKTSECVIGSSVGGGCAAVGVQPRKRDESTIVVCKSAPGNDDFSDLWRRSFVGGSSVIGQPHWSGEMTFDPVGVRSVN
jgi:hypothetical protein